MTDREEKDPPDGEEPTAEPESTDEAASDEDASLDAESAGDEEPSADEDAREPRAPRERPGPGAVAGGVALVLLALNLGGSAVALPALQAHVDASFRELVWVQVAFLLGIAVVLPLAPALGVAFGRRGALLLGASALVSGTAVTALAPSAEVVIAGRALQGVGAAVFLVLLATPGLVFAVALAAAPIVGGALVKALDWEWLFWLQLPLIALVLVAALRDAEAEDPRAAPSDPIGALNYAAGLTALVIALVQADAWDWRLVVGLAGAGAIALASLVPLDRRATRPVVDFRPFRDPTFLATALATAVLAGAFWAVLTLEAQNLQDLYDHGALAAGLILLPLTVPLLLAPALRGRADDRALMLGALVVGVGGLVIFGLIDDGGASNDVRAVPGLLLMGLAAMGAAAALPGLAVARVPVVETSPRSTVAARRTSASRSTGRSSAEREGARRSSPAKAKRPGKQVSTPKRGRVGAAEAAAARKRREEREKAGKKEGGGEEPKKRGAEETKGRSGTRAQAEKRRDAESGEAPSLDTRPEPGALEWSRLAGGVVVFAALSSLFLSLFSTRRSELTPSASEGGPGPNTPLDGLLAGSADVSHRLSEFPGTVRFGVEIAARDALGYASGRCLFLAAALLLAAVLLMWRLGRPPSQPEPERDDPRHSRFPL